MSRAVSFSVETNASLRAALRELMERRGWRQREAAAALGVSQQTVSGFLAGRWGASYPLAWAIADASGRLLSEFQGLLRPFVTVTTLPELTFADGDGR